MSTGTQGQNTVNSRSPYNQIIGQGQNGGLLSGMSQSKYSGEDSVGGPYPDAGGVVGGAYPEQGPMGGNRLPDTEIGPYNLPINNQSGEPNPYAGDYGTNSLGNSSTSFSYQQPAYTPNPYLDQQAQNITRGFNRNLQEQVLPGLRSRFIGSGGLGGSRQGIAEGLATARSGEGLSSAITNMYAQDYENSQNRGLQGSIANMNSGLSARNMDLQDQMNRLNSERGFYTSQRGQDLQQLGLAAGLLGQANQGFMGQGQGIYGIGQQEQNAPWQQLQNYSGLLAPYQQAGATNTQGQQYSYNPTMQYIGGNMQAAASILPMLSDARLKENIKPVGETYDGLTTYTYNYKWDDTPQMGVMAQEVERKKPEAMGPTVGGYKSVRYGLLG